MQENSKNILSPQQTSTFSFAFAATLILCLAQPRMLSFLPELVALICGGLYFFAQKKFPVINRALLLYIIGFLTLAALSAIWAPEPSYAFAKVIKTAVLVAFGYILIILAQNLSTEFERKKRLFVTLALPFAFFCGLFFVEYTFHYPVMRFLIGDILHQSMPLSVENAYLFNRSSVFLVLYAAPLFYMIRYLDIPRTQKIFFSIGLLFFLAIGIWHSESQTAQIAAVIMATMYVFPSHHKIARTVFTGFLVAGFIIMPFLPKPSYDYLIAHNLAEKPDGFVMRASIPQRLEVWSFVSGEIFKSPLIGHGVESTRSMKSEKMMTYFQTTHVIHPHNVALQIWIEMGIVGIVLVSAFFFFLTCKMDGLPPTRQKFYMAMFAGILSVLAMGYGIWQAWQVGMIMAITAFAIMATKLYEPASRF